MAHPYHHALSSVKKWGGAVEDYLPVHNWFDASKEILADFRHRALRHHAESIFMAETIFGPTITLSSGRVIPTRWVGEQHVREDLGHIPSFADWARAIRPSPWMGRTVKIEAEVEPALPASGSKSDPIYDVLGVSADAGRFTVLRAAARAMHPSIRRDSSLRLSRRRFYRQMLAAHAAAGAGNSQEAEIGPD